jgi:hypothetical protein
MEPRHARNVLVVSALGLALGACPSPPTPASDADPTDGESADVDPAFATPPAVCRAGTPWSPGRPVFQGNGTAAWGLTAARATGLAAGDLDGDGYPDLVVFDGAVNARSDLDATPPVYHARVYMNRPRAGGAGRAFVDATRASNLLELRGGGTGRVVQFVVLGDVDSDGDLDAYTGVSPQSAPPAGTPMDPGDRSAIALNDGHGVFHLAPESDATPASTEFPQTTGVVFTDHNRDGVLDLWVGYQSSVFGQAIGQQPQLFRGRGDGTFADVTDEVGLTLGASNASLTAGTNARPLYGVSACDVNDDGRQDLLGMAYGRQFNQLFVNAGDHYDDVSLASGVGGDDNRDYSDNLSYRCYCAEVAGRCPATVPAPPAMYCPGRGWRAGVDDLPWRLNGNTFSIACGDVDNDGDVDLYTAEIVHPDVGGSSDRSELLVNDSAGGAVHFSRPGRTAMGLGPAQIRTNDEGGLGNALWDFDGDGRLDAFVANSDYTDQYGWLFHQDAAGSALHFTEVGAAAGFRHACPHGIALADFDLDGDVDVIVGSSTFRTWCNAEWHGQNEVRLYENVAGEATNWTRVQLVGRGAGGASRSAIGARVRVTAGGVTQTREIQGAWGTPGLSAELVAHFGLGAQCAIDRLEVRWPDAVNTVETFTDIRANYRIEIRQGEGRVRYLR